MSSATTTPSSPYSVIKRHVHAVFGVISAKRHRITSLFLGQNSLAKRKSDGSEAKSGNSSDMVLISPIISPIEQTDKREKKSACSEGANSFSQRVGQTSEPQPQPLTAASLSLLPRRPDPRATTAQYIQDIPSPPSSSSSCLDLDCRIRSSSIVEVCHNSHDYAHNSCCSSLGARTLEEEKYDTDDVADDEGKVVVSGPTFFWSVDDEGCVVGNEMEEIESDSEGSTVEVDDGDKSQFAWIFNRDFY